MQHRALDETALAQVLEALRLPRPLSAFAYGSGVYHQPSLDATMPMIDYILIVNNAEAWHRENIARNRSHYSFLASFGASALTSISSRVDAGVYFNPLVKHEDRHIKYGVIQRDRLAQDLLTWNDLYIAGRLQKPVRHLTMQQASSSPPPPLTSPHFPLDSLLATAQRRNLAFTLCTASLLRTDPTSGTPHHTFVSWHDLLMSIVGISYTGDVRMGWAEDAKKVERIVAGSGSTMEAMYAHVLEHDEEKGMEDEEEVEHEEGEDLWRAFVHHDANHLDEKGVRIESSLDARHALVAGLAPAVRDRVLMQLGASTRDIAAHGARSVGLEALRDAPLGRMVHTAVGSIVARSSARQAALGILSAGLWNAGKYVMRKVSKAVGSS